MTKHVGHDFTKRINLSLLPGVTLAKGYWMVTLSYVTDDHGSTVFNNDSWNCGGDLKDFEVIVGRDVQVISFMVHRHNSFPGYPNTYLKYSLRVDRLILLNMVEKLIGSTIKI